MYLAVGKTIVMRIVATVLFFLLTQPIAKADEAQLTVTPDKCVALREGQTCYQNLRIRFSPITSGDYCLMVADQTLPLRCWVGAGPFEYRYSLESAKDVDFTVLHADQSVVAGARVTISWVYKQSRRRSRWRLF